MGSKTVAYWPLQWATRHGDLVATSTKFNAFRKCASRVNSGRDLELVYQLFDYVLDGNTGDDDSTVYKNDGRDWWTYDDFDKQNEGPGNRIEFGSAMDGRSGGGGGYGAL